MHGNPTDAANIRNTHSKLAVALPHHVSSPVCRLKSNDLYLTGESYAGQYVPNIAHYIVNNEPFKSRLNLKGVALGNACWGGAPLLLHWPRC